MSTTTEIIKDELIKDKGLFNQRQLTFMLIDFVKEISSIFIHQPYRSFTNPLIQSIFID